VRGLGKRLKMIARKEKINKIKKPVRGLGKLLNMIEARK
jgi:hypothetical protein